MNLFRWTILLLLAFSVAGCKRHRVEPAATEPLTIEAWSSLPSETKYEVSTLERLKLGTPKLQDDQEWDRFARTVMIPARQKELPKGMPGT